SIRCRTRVVPTSQNVPLPERTPRAHLMSLRSRLGKAAVIGGRAYVERFATSDEFAAIFMYGLDPAGRKNAIDMVVRITAKTPYNPLPVTPSAGDRVKIRWTDTMIARFKAEAPSCGSDVELAQRLGLPSFCRAAVRVARCRHGFRRGSKKGDAQSLPRTGSP